MDAFDCIRFILYRSKNLFNDSNFDNFTYLVELLLRVIISIKVI